MPSYLAAVYQCGTAPSRWGPCTVRSVQVFGESQLPNIWWTETRLKRLTEPCIFCNVWLKVAIYFPSICCLTPVCPMVHDLMITVHPVLQPLLTIYEVVLRCHTGWGQGSLEEVCWPGRVLGMDVGVPKLPSCFVWVLCTCRLWGVWRVGGCGGGVTEGWSFSSVGLGMGSLSGWLPSGEVDMKAGSRSYETEPTGRVFTRDGAGFAGRLCVCVHVWLCVYVCVYMCIAHVIIYLMQWTKIISTAILVVSIKVWYSQQFW